MKHGIQIIPQRSAQGIAEFLNSVCKRHEDNNIKQESFVKVLLNDAVELLPQYNEAWEGYHETAQGRRGFRGERRELVKDLKRTLSDYWSALVRRTRRMKHPNWLLGEFRRPQFKESLANVHREADLISIGKTFVRGEKVMVEKGYPAMANPSGAEIQALLDAIAILDADQTTDSAYMMAQKAFHEKLSAGIRLHRLLSQALMISLDELELSQMRRILREYGYTLAGAVSDTPAEEDALIDTPEEEEDDLAEEPLDEVPYETEQSVGGAAMQTIVEMEDLFSEEASAGG